MLQYKSTKGRDVSYISFFTVFKLLSVVFQLETMKEELPLKICMLCFVTRKSFLLKLVCARIHIYWSIANCQCHTHSVLLTLITEKCNSFKPFRFVDTSDNGMQLILKASLPSNPQDFFCVWALETENARLLL